MRWSKDFPESLPWIGVSLSVALIACASAGAVSLIDASSTAQRALDGLRTQICRPGIACVGHWTVSGFGDSAVLVLLGLTLILLTLTVLTIGRGQSAEGLGERTAALAIVPILTLWLDALLVGQSPSGGGDSVGVAGPASTAIDHAGWLFCAAVALCIVTTAWMHLRVTDGDTYSKPYEVAG